MASDNNYIHPKGIVNMKVMEMSKKEIMKNTIDDFEKVQRCMVLATKEKAVKTYAELKR